MSAIGRATWRAGFAGLGLPPFDAALANPPFFDDPARPARPAPGQARAPGWPTTGWRPGSASCSRPCARAGPITLIHRADRLADILALLAAPRPARSRSGRSIPSPTQPAKRVLVRAIKTGKAPLRLLPPLVLHDRAGAKHTPEAEAILRGEAALDWV